MITLIWHICIWFFKQQEGSHISWKFQQVNVRPQTALVENESQEEVALDQHSEAPGEQSKGLSPP
jgi:hypothetical protein